MSCTQLDINVVLNRALVLVPYPNGEVSNMLVLIIIIPSSSFELLRHAMLNQSIIKQLVVATIKTSKRTA